MLIQIDNKMIVSRINNEEQLVLGNRLGKTFIIENDEEKKIYKSFK
jgi:hypothetical protein